MLDIFVTTFLHLRVRSIQLTAQKSLSLNMIVSVGQLTPMDNIVKMNKIAICWSASLSLTRNQMKYWKKFSALQVEVAGWLTLDQSIMNTHVSVFYCSPVVEPPSQWLFSWLYMGYLLWKYWLRSIERVRHNFTVSVVCDRVPKKDTEDKCKKMWSGKGEFEGGEDLAGLKTLTSWARPSLSPPLLFLLMLPYSNHTS